ncbi:Cobalamin synthase [Candidatus Terasakiella magnetica]|uniref:Adenosylcobinamide-GDP ribazoletransferase n=1 Tax=Candidatus Terasakiella magnetica TaxID=1867952 RepID=A0A1C3RF03_9PROT|nr:adenosylcobinamide-GDP ribazoletransferase [Candidatus Terasakiella magnetica]SCA55812.1 Cobalamin synthase [Candidatus Terasakiella magnetica]
MTDTSSTFEKNAQNPKAWWEDIQLAVVFLTRLPWKLKEELAPQALNRALRAFPLIGLLVGGLSATVYGLAHIFEIPPLACGLLAVLTSVLLTGALHEDGLADVADGFGGGASRERKLEIMRDSSLGSYGTIALILSIGLRSAALGGFEDWMVGASVIVAVSCLSRIAPALLIYLMESARTDGLAASMEKPDWMIVVQACGLGIALFLLCTPLDAGFVTIVMGFTALYVFQGLAQKQIGGQTGDVCGAAQQVMEITMIVVLAGLA